VKDQYTYFHNKILNLNTIFLPEETTTLNLSSKLVGTYITQYDTEAEIRENMSLSARYHKYYGVFNQHWKRIIDDFLGGDSSIYTGGILRGAFIVAQSTISGSDLIGYNGAPVFLTKTPAVVYIDLDVVPTINQTVILLQKLKPFVPIYFNVYIGNKYLYSTSPDVYDFKKVGKV
jgi:hypothetical protein